MSSWIYPLTSAIISLRLRELAFRETRQNRLDVPGIDSTREYLIPVRFSRGCMWSSLTRYMRRLSRDCPGQHRITCAKLDEKSRQDFFFSYSLLLLKKARPNRPVSPHLHLLYSEYFFKSLQQLCLSSSLWSDV